MYYLAVAFPGIAGRRLPISRDQIVLLLVAVNLIFLGLDTFLSHYLNNTIRAGEWIPIIFGPIAGALLLLAGLIAFRNRLLASTIASLTLFASIAVGLLGAYFHFVRGTLPTAPLGDRVSVDLLIWAPPVLGPLYFALFGLLGISAAWEEKPADSGQLIITKIRRLQLPYSKTRAFLFTTTLGILAAIVSSTLDHARTGFQSPWVWIPLAAGTFALVTTTFLGIVDRPSRTDVRTHIVAMLVLILVGMTGLFLHVSTNLIAEGVFITERFLRGAPFMAPMLFANMGALGLIVLLDPGSTPVELARSQKPLD